MRYSDGGNSALSAFHTLHFSHFSPFSHLPSASFLGSLLQWDTSCISHSSLTDSNQVNGTLHDASVHREEKVSTLHSNNEKLLV